MEAAAIVIPLVGLALPIGLILLAVLIDVIAVLWFGYRMWHDEWSGRIGHLITDHVVSPLHRVSGAHRFALPHRTR